LSDAPLMNPKIDLAGRLSAATRRRDTLHSRVVYLNGKIEANDAHAFIKAEKAALDYAIKLIDVDILQIKLMLQRLEDKTGVLI